MLDLEASALFIKLRYYSGRQMGVEQLICSLGYAGCCDQSQSLHIRSVSYHQITARGQLRSIRSEEHTSELQSLMRTSYAVFCLKKKNKLTYVETHTHMQEA